MDKPGVARRFALALRTWAHVSVLPCVSLCGASTMLAQACTVLHPHRASWQVPVISVWKVHACEPRISDSAYPTPAASE